jgi:hypothetical protein
MLFARKLATGIIFFDRLIRLTISPYLVRSLALEVIFLCNAMFDLLPIVGIAGHCIFGN